jgi:hypothetical protein
MSYVEHWITAGIVVDPTPLSRPFTRTDLSLALAAVDTNRLGHNERRVLSAIRDDLNDRERSAAVRLFAHASIAAATHTRRDPLRALGPELGTAAGGAGVELRLDQVVATTHPYFDTRLRRDPDYRGIKSRAIAGRNAEAYIDARWRFGELFFGTVDRNWGPPVVESLLLSSAPYGYDHLLIGLGTRSVRLEGVATQLDNLADTAGVLNHRYFVAHRLLLRPPGHTTIVLWEGTLIAGRDRTLEPWFANILNLGLLAQYDQGVTANNQLGIDVQTRIGGVTAFASLLIDDYQVDRSTLTDQEPPQYGATLGAQGGLAHWSWSAWYTRIANLTYRTDNPVETVMRRGVGLARDFSDYDQLTLRATRVVGPGVLIAPEVTVLRQGEGDLRAPYPPPSAFPTTPTFLSGVVERTVRLALGVRADTRRVGLKADAGIHFVNNAGHVTGTNDSRFVGSVTLEFRLARSTVLP